MTKKLMTLKDMQEYTGISVATLSVARKAGRLPDPVIEHGNRRYWTKPDIDAWLSKETDPNGKSPAVPVKQTPKHRPIKVSDEDLFGAAVSIAMSKECSLDNAIHVILESVASSDLVERA